MFVRLIGAPCLGIESLGCKDRDWNNLRNTELERSAAGAPYSRDIMGGLIVDWTVPLACCSFEESDRLQ